MTHINGNDLLALGYPENELLGIALKINKKRLGLTKTEMLNHSDLILKHPESYLDNPFFGVLAKAIVEGAGSEEDEISLNETPESYAIYGRENIEKWQLRQAVA